MSTLRSPARPNEARSSAHSMGAPTHVSAVRIDANARTADTRVAVDAFRRIVRRLRIAAHGVVGQTGMTAAQQFVLALLAQQSAESLQALAHRTMTDRSSVRAIVDRLIERGFVQCQPAATDRRRTTIQITSQGRAMLRRAPEPPTALLVRGLDALSSADVTRLATLMHQLVGAMGLSDDPPTMLFDDDRPVLNPAPPSRRASRTSSAVKR
ncbi:MAG TPA: MarR family transcriptional regulator [Gemmatimonadaceae bacterium]|nr:MarR family transcriptional regulator [Gemmatimonadaceae bacterium]